MKRLIASLATCLVALGVIVLPLDVALAAPRTQTATLHVEGIPRVGNTLTASPSGLASNSKITYSWTVNGVKKSSTASLLLDDTVPTGATIILKMMAKKSGFKDFSVTTLPIVEGTLSQTQIGSISGAAVLQVGNSLTAQCGNYVPSLTQSLNPASCSYQWKADNAELQNQQGNTLLLTSGLIGKHISVALTVTADGFAPKISEVQGVGVVKGLLSITSEPVFNQEDKAGSDVTVLTPPSYNQQPEAISYQWLRDGKVINGETEDTYTIQTADWHKEISVKIRATKTNYLDLVQEWSVVERPLKLVSKIVTSSNGFWAFDSCDYGDYWSYGCWTTGYKTAFGGNMNYNGYADYTHMNLNSYSEFNPQNVSDWRMVVYGSVTRGLKVKVGVATDNGMGYADYTSTNTYSAGGKWVSRWSTIAPIVGYDQQSWKYYGFVEARDANKKVNGTFKIVKVQIEVRYFN